MNFVDNTIDLPWRNFSSQVYHLGQSCRGKALIFGDTRISLQHSGKKLPYQNQLNQFRRFDTHWLVTDRQTDRHTMTAYRASVWSGTLKGSLSLCHYAKTRRHPQKNRSTWRIAMRSQEVPSNNNGHCKKLREFWRSGFDIGAYVCNRHTDTETET